MSDDDITPPRRRRMSNIPAPADDFDSPNGKFRIIVREEIEGKINGSLERLEKSQRWLRSILYFMGLGVSVVGIVLGVDHWVQSVAKKQELGELKYEIDRVSKKVDTIGTSLQELRETVREQSQKKPTWGGK